MTRPLSLVTLVVRDYDEALAFFVDSLRFHVVEDRQLSETKRWVVVSGGAPGASLLLAKAVNPEQLASVGNQAGGRVAFFLETADFWADYGHMQSQGVRFDEAPREEAYATVVVFRDLYNNRWDLLQRR